MRVVILGLLTLMPGAYASSDFEREQIQQRISPVGQVRIQDSSAASVAATSPAPAVEPATKKSPGQEIYERNCSVCHQDGVAGAPKFRKVDEWGVRTSKKSIDALTASAIKGLNAMPPKGTCQECTESDIKAAINYMVPQS